MGNIGSFRLDTGSRRSVSPECRESESDSVCLTQ